MLASPSAVMATLARTLLGDDPETRRIGDVTLHRHQALAIGRVQQAIDTYGGALLCDDVGLGKTYVALAVASTYESVAIITPAALRTMWCDALKATGIVAEIISMESLGRGDAPVRRRQLLVVDEAHHFRNPCTRRYVALARLCTLTPALLLTATPLHNTRDDVAALAALFLGSHAYQMTDAEFGLISIRRVVANCAANQKIPALAHSPPRVIISDEAVLDLIMSIPPPVPPREGNIATLLVIHGLVRQWASSVSALTAAVKRRIARSCSLLELLDAGRYPTSKELAAWVYLGDAVQLAFGELLVQQHAPPASLAASLRKHVAALRGLLNHARDMDDSSLVEYVREIRSAHPCERIVAFSCYAETAQSLFRALREDGHVALLTARGALIATGPVSRAEVLAQFDPGSPASQGIKDHNSIDLLVATDLLSEGVNLQCASVVIHLDLPWTAARIKQRIGRLVRLGSPHDRVVSYTVAPPPRAELYLHELETIARKAGISEQFLGDPLQATEKRNGNALTDSREIGEGEAIRRLLEYWRDPAMLSQPQPCPEVAYLVAANRGAVGVWLVDGTAVLLCMNDIGVASDISSMVLRSLQRVAQSRVARAQEDQAALSTVLQAAIAWNDNRRAWAAVAGSARAEPKPAPRDARHILARVADATVNNSTFAHRNQSAATAARLRNAAARPLPLAVEWSLESLAECADDATVSTILDLVDTARPIPDRVCARGFRCVAVIVFVPEATSMA